MGNQGTAGARITGVNVIFIPSSDVDRSRDWYERNLGYEWREWVLVSPDGAPPIFLCPADENWNFRMRDGRDCAAMSLRVTDIDDLRNRLIGNGAEVGEIKAFDGIGRELSFRDPDGNLLQVTQPPS